MARGGAGVDPGPIWARVDEAPAACAGGVWRSHGRARTSPTSSRVLAALGQLSLRCGNVEGQPAATSRPARTHEFERGVERPKTTTIVSDAIETLVALGELEQASTDLDHYRTYAVRSGSPLAAAWEARCRGLLAAAKGDLERLLRSVRARSRGTGRSLPGRARPHSALPRRGAGAGAAEEGGPRGARGGACDLRGARCGAMGGEGPSRAGDGSVGGTPASDELTESERRVAELASPGAYERRRSRPSCSWV